MAIASALPRNPANVTEALPGRRFDHFFFASMALLMSFTVFVGFARTYFLAGMFRAPLPSLIIHIHGAAFATWMLLLVVQTRWSPAAAWTFIAVWGLRAFSSRVLWSYSAFWQPPIRSSGKLVLRVEIRNSSTSSRCRKCWSLGRSSFLPSVIAPIPQHTSASSSSPRLH